MNQVSLDQLTFATFSDLSGTRFRVRADENSPVELELTGVVQFQPRMPGNAEGSERKNECFTLTFTGPASRFLEQKIYTFEHDSLGAFSVFMVPIGKSQDAFEYEVVFNRFV